MKKLLPLLFVAVSLSACKKQALEITPDELGGTYRSVAGQRVTNLFSCVALPGGISSNVPELRLDSASPSTATLVYQANTSGVISEKSLSLTTSYREEFIEISYQGRVIGDYRVGTVQDGKRERPAKVLSLMIFSSEEKVDLMFRGVKE